MGLIFLASISRADQLQAINKSKYAFYQYYDDKLINGGNCEDTLIGHEFVVRLAAFNNFKGRIGNCDLLTITQEKSVHNAYSLDSKAHTIIFESLALEPQEQSYGSVIITSEVLTEIKKIESN